MTLFWGIALLLVVIGVFLLATGAEDWINAEELINLDPDIDVPIPVRSQMPIYDWQETKDFDD